VWFTPLGLCVLGVERDGTRWNAILVKESAGAQ
jgi:hypothetical protein